jgi:hypothetical protein
MPTETKPITVVTLNSEEAYFRKREGEKIRALREKATHEASTAYAEEHRNHCFRCGTPTLVEVDQGKVKVDMCVNAGCGAVHLDPGELDALLADQTLVKRLRKAVFACFE